MQPAVQRIGRVSGVEVSGVEVSGVEVSDIASDDAAPRDPIEPEAIEPEAAAAPADADTAVLPTDIDPYLVPRAVDWVRQAKAVKTVEQALVLLSQSDFHGRWEVVKRFPELGQAAIAPLIAIAQDSKADTEHRWFAIRILGRFSEPEAITALGNLVAVVDHDDLSALAAEQLAGLGKQAITALLPLLEQPTERLLAVRALAQIRQRAVIDPLLGVLTDPDPHIRQTALEALGSFHSPRVTAALLVALQDPSSRVRQEAVTTLGHRHDLCGQPAQLKPLERCLADVDITVACQAAIAIGRLGLPQSLPALTRLLASDLTPEPLLLHTVRALSWFDTPTAQAALLGAYGKFSAAVQLEAIRRLGYLKADPHQGTEFLLAVLESGPSLAIKQAAALSLGQLGDSTAFPRLAALLADPNRQAQFHYLRALEQLAPNDLETDLETLLNSHTLPAAVQTHIEGHLSTW